MEALKSCPRVSCTCFFRLERKSKQEGVNVKLKEKYFEMLRNAFNFNSSFFSF